MNTMNREEYLAHINAPLKMADSRITGNRSPSIGLLNGSAMPNSVSLSTGDFIAYLHSAANGIPETCMFRAAGSLNIM